MMTEQSQVQYVLTVKSFTSGRGIYLAVSLHWYSFRAV